jgi:hypothetical protein
MEAVRMEKTLNEIFDELVEENKNPDSGKTLDELYHEANEKYIDHLSSRHDWMMMQAQEGLI